MKKNFTRSTEQIDLGKYLHTADETPVLQLTCENIPYPNSPVLYNNKIIGKIDEVLGSLNDVYASVILDKNVNTKNFNKNSIFQAYKDKFMFKNRFLPRSEVEKKKEEKDKINKYTKSMNKETYKNDSINKRNRNNGRDGSKFEKPQRNNHNNKARNGRNENNYHDRKRKHGTDNVNKRFK